MIICYALIKTTKSGSKNIIQSQFNRQNKRDYDCNPWNDTYLPACYYLPTYLQSVVALYAPSSSLWSNFFPSRVESSTIAHSYRWYTSDDHRPSSLTSNPSVSQKTHCFVSCWIVVVVPKGLSMMCVCLSFEWWWYVCVCFALLPPAIGCRSSNDDDVTSYLPLP